MGRAANKDSWNRSQLCPQSLKENSGDDDFRETRSISNSYIVLSSKESLQPFTVAVKFDRLLPGLTGIPLAAIGLQGSLYPFLSLFHVQSCTYTHRDMETLPQFLHFVDRGKANTLSKVL